MPTPSDLQGRGYHTSLRSPRSSREMGTQRWQRVTTTLDARGCPRPRPAFTLGASTIDCKSQIAVLQQLEDFQLLKKWGRKHENVGESTTVSNPELLKCHRLVLTISA